MNARIVGVLFAALIVGGATSARADSIAVTGGSFGSDNDVSELRLTSSQFDLTLGGFGHEMTAVGQLLPGNMAELTTTFTGPVSGGGSINGVAYPTTGNPPFGSNALAGTANLIFSTSPFPFTSGQGDFNVTVPFTLGGTLQLTAADGPVLNSALTSSGTLTYFANGVSGPFGSTFNVDIVGMRFSAGGAPSPTPEPASLILLATGLVGGVVRRRFAF